MARFTNQDQDQEVKECAITCMGLVVSTFGDHLQTELPACLPVLVDRMGNEITRLTAVKGFCGHSCFSIAPRPVMCYRASNCRVNGILTEGKPST
nr:cullin-associated NEDD8-dissociated protein 1 [Ipomoea batatas]GMD42417.1 cullin-associated NEDD8-dissociated protein 1 [Ipomoea batatas]GMD43959.1 cullin-associated NEDD8-dissociated protein 1 [Ipomoea batatas]GMD47300.1 cullin-associated NEDD8-dissociated protein 1 [Ipomoea batatas]